MKIKRSHDLIFTKDIHSIYLGCNDTFAKSLGLSANDVIGKTDFEFHWSHNFAKEYRKRDKKVLSGTPLINFLEVHPLITGELIKVNVTKMPIYNAAGVITGLTCHYYFHDTMQSYITAQQTKCLYYLSQGRTAKEIAKFLNLSYRTIEFYIAILKDKFECKNTVQLVAKAISLQLIPPLSK